MNRAAALYAILYDLLADVNAVNVGVAALDTKYDLSRADIASIRTQLIAAIDDDDNFRTAYDAAAALKTRYNLGSPEAEDDNQVVASTDVKTAAQTYTIAANPDVPRNLTFTHVVGGAIDLLYTVIGFDQFGESVTETFAATSSAEVTGAKIFKTITSVTMTTVTTDTGANTVICGTGALIGLPVQITQAADVVKAFLNGVKEATDPTGDATYHAVTLNSAPDGNEILVVVQRDGVGATAKTATDPDAITGGAAVLGSVGVTAPEPKSRDPQVDE
jgi:hypothetical protein